MIQSEQRFSNKVGEEYDLFSLALPHQNEIQTKSVERLITHFSNKSDLKILEIGFGTGITSYELLSQSRKIHLVGIDNEPRMLSKALNKLKDFPYTKFELQIIDALEYLEKQDSNTYNAIISVWVLHNLQKDFRYKIYKEIYRVLKPGGIFVNGDKIAVVDTVLHQDHLDWQLKQFDVYESMGRPELKKEWTEHYLEDESVDRILYENVFIEDLQNIGFKNCLIGNRNYMDAISSGVKE